MRRIEVQADHVAQLGRERRIGGQLEAPYPVRLETVRRPDPLHRAQRYAADRRHGAAGPMGRLAGGSPSVSATTRSTATGGKGGRPGLRVLSRTSPATPSRMNRSCQRQTQGLDTLARRMISAVPQPAAVARMIRARQTCFCGLFRSATIRSSRSRSAALASMLIPARMPQHATLSLKISLLRQPLVGDGLEKDARPAAAATPQAAWQDVQPHHLDTGSRGRRAAPRDGRNEWMRTPQTIG